VIHRSKELVKNAVAWTLYVTGVLRLLLAMRFRKRAAILMYHRVLPEGLQTDSFTADSIRVTPEEFDWQMQTIGRYLRPTSLAALRAAFESAEHEIPSRACVVTFDDGWFDNSAYAAPILERRRVPATIFVATHYIGSNECFWQEELTRVLYEAWRKPELGADLLPLLRAERLAGTPASEARRVAREVVTALKSKPPQEIAELKAKARAIAAAHGVDAQRTGDDRFMSWEDVVAISRSGLVEIMSHATSHTPLDRLPAEALQRELEDSRTEIASRTGASVEALAYPNGDFDEGVIAAARRAGYGLALTTLGGAASKKDDALRLPRINIQSSGARSRPRFLCRLAGLF
jgi:peptidoglycan/xylan/chitin deacetylase (PgdA/CDA1 family)